MKHLPAKVRTFVVELRRRRVFRVAAGYAIVAWVAVQVASVTFPPLHLPPWAVTAVVVAALLGFPIALIFGWTHGRSVETDRQIEPLPDVTPVATRRPDARYWATVLIALLGLGLVGGYWTVRRIAFPRPAEDNRVGIAVFPFRATGVAVQDWSEGVADLLSTYLDGTQGIRVADPWSLWRNLRPQRTARAEAPDPAEAAKFARAAGVDRFVLGSVVGTDQSLELNVRIYGVGRAEPLHTFAERGTPDSLAKVAQRLAVQVISRIWERDQLPSVPQLEQYATHSAEALKAYLAAKAAMRRGQIDSANIAIDHALTVDSTFALALVEATVIKSWVQYTRGQFFTGLMQIAERAVAESDKLSERNRLRAQAALASIRTDGRAAAAAARRIVEIDSTDLDAWNSLAYYHIVYGWQYGAGDQEALAAAERAVRLDSTHVPALLKRTGLAVTLEGPEALRLQMERLLRADTTTTLIRGALLGLRAILVSDSAFPALVDSIAAVPLGVQLTGVRYLRERQPERAEQLLARLRREGASEESLRAASGEHARLLIAQGRLQEVESAIEAGDYQVSELYKHLRRFFIAATIAGVGDSAIAKRAADWLAEYIPPDSALAYFETRPVWWSGWLLGAYHASVGDTLVARRWHQIIGTLPAGGTPLDYRGGLQSDIEARLAARRGDLSAALDVSKRAFELWSIHTGNDWEALAAPAMRFHLAMLYRETGRPDSAQALLRSLVPPTSWMGFYTARASLELGELAENRGDRQEAVRHYLTALRLWERGGPEMRTWRDRARTGLARVTGERAASS